MALDKKGAFFLSAWTRNKSVFYNSLEWPGNVANNRSPFIFAQWFFGLIPQGSAAIIEQLDASTAAGDAGIRGAVIITDNLDLATASGLSRLVGSAAATEAFEDQSTASAIVQFIGSATISENLDTSAAVGILRITGSSTASELNDASSASGLLVLTGPVIITDEFDLMEAVGSGSLPSFEIITDFSVLNEILANIFLQQAGYVDFNTSLFVENMVPIEPETSFAGNTVLLTTTTSSLTFSGDIATSMDSLQGSQILMLLDASTLLSATASPLSDLSLNLSLIALISHEVTSLIRSELVTPVDLQVAFISETVSLCQLLSISAADALVKIEFGGAIQVESSTTSNIEWRASLLSQSISPSALDTLLRADTKLELTTASEILSRAIMQDEYRASVFTNTVAQIEASIAQFSLVTGLTDIATAVRAAALANVSIFANLIRDQQLHTDTLTSYARNFSASIESMMLIGVSSQSPSEVLTGSNLDALINSDWFGYFSRDFVCPAEFTIGVACDTFMQILWITTLSLKRLEISDSAYIELLLDAAQTMNLKLTDERTWIVAQKSIS